MATRPQSPRGCVTVGFPVSSGHSRGEGLGVVSLELRRVVTRGIAPTVTLGVRIKSALARRSHGRVYQDVKQQTLTKNAHDSGYHSVLHHTGLGHHLRNGKKEKRKEIVRLTLEAAVFGDGCKTMSVAARRSFLGACDIKNMQIKACDTENMQIMKHG